MNIQTPQQFAAAVRRSIDENYNTFQSKGRIISDYQGEEGLRKAYDGRQLLEMLQNADDAGATAVNIALDRKRKCISFSNTGVPFSAAGIASLMVRDLSTKRGKKNFIGNKGLGFRSLLNWAKRIFVHSHGNSLEFSQDIARREFLALVPDQAERAALLAEGNYPPGAVTFPFLGIPDISPEPKQTAPWDTVIEVFYHDQHEQTIEKQLAEFKQEILIFLPHIESLTIEDGEAITYSATKRKPTTVQAGELALKQQHVSIGEKSWQTFEQSAALPSEYQEANQEGQKHYSIKVAVSPSLSDSYNKLFNFFPTQLNIHLPCLVHGTFDLEPSRNHLTPDPVNKYLFEQLAGLLSAVALHTREKVSDWRAFRLLTPAQDAPSDTVRRFYNLLLEKRNSQPLIPTMDGKYRTAAQSAFHGQEFSKFVGQHGLGANFGLLMLPLAESIAADAFLLQKSVRYTTNSLHASLQAPFRKNPDMALLAKLIRLLISPSFRADKQGQYPLLLNKQKKFIPVSEVAFTPVSRGKELKKPSFVDIDFINRALYEALLTEFGITGTRQARELENKLKEHFNVKEYEPAPVIESYIRSAVSAIGESKPTAAKQLVREMVSCLYEISGVLSAKASPLENQRINELIAGGVPLISRNGKVTANNKLIFGREYPEGVLAEHIFALTHTSADYLAPPARYGLEKENLEEVAQFFKWLKVDSYSQVEPWREHNAAHPYISYTFKKQGRPMLLSSVNVSGIRIKGLGQVTSLFGTKISPEQFLAWIIKDEKVNRALAFPTERLNCSYNQRGHMIQAETSYIKWQLQSAGLFENYVIEERKTAGVNTLHIDFGHRIFTENGIRAEAIEKALVHLGACKSFDELSVPATFAILERLSAAGPTEMLAISTPIYKLAIKNLSQPSKKEEAAKHPKIKLPARLGKQAGFRPAGEVYYSDNHNIPEKVINGLWMFQYPKRKGEKQISEFFGTRSLSALRPKIITAALKLSRLQGELDNFLAQARVYILALRIQDMVNPDFQASSAAQLEEMQLLLVDSCKYSIEGSETLALEEGEFLSVEKSFYFRVPAQTASFAQLERLNAFRDCFAESLSILFKVTDLGTAFRNVLANGIEDTAYLIEKEHGSGLLDRARQLLQLHPAELAYWRRVLAHLGKNLNTEGLGKEGYYLRLQNLLGLRLPQEYPAIDFNKPTSSAGLSLSALLKGKLGVPIEKTHPEGIAGYHLEKLQHWEEHYQAYLDALVYRDCQADKKSQKNFLNKLTQSRNSTANLLPQLARSKRFEILQDYDKAFRAELKRAKGINIQAGQPIPGPILNRYPNLQAKFPAEWSGLSPENQSLSLFPGHWATVLKALLDIRGIPGETLPAEGENETGGEDGVPPPIVTGRILPVELSNPASQPQGPKTENKGSGHIFDQRRNRQNSQAGNSAERLVRDTFVKAYGRQNVKWVSGNSDEGIRNDALGYDLKYRVDESSPWHLLEVKNTSGNTFIISSNEVTVGTANAHNYHLALVNGTDIRLSEGFFSNPQWKGTFKINGSYSAVPNDWLVSFETKEKDTPQTF